MNNQQLGGCVRGLWSELVPGVVHSESASGAHGNILGRISFAIAPAPPDLVDGAPHLTTHMASGIDLVAEEIWRTTLPVRSGMAGDAVFAEDGEYLFYAVRLRPRSVSREGVRELYETAMRFAWVHGYTDLVRMWNLIGGTTVHDAKRAQTYRDFRAGRADAFAAWEQQFQPMPAATVIGTLSPGVDLCFIATKPGRTVHLENPPQIPGCEGRAGYGPPPSCTRATYLKQHGTGSLFISGAASSLGGDTPDLDDVERQTVEALDNIAALIGGYNLSRYGLGCDGFVVRNLDQVKVYVRDRENVPVVRDICSRILPAYSEIAYFNVGVCRAEQLVEIEAVCQ
ncbi:hypothetical protein [Nocardia alni]|uniref:chorismate transformation enzyme, FkbO/Hyg5 family n=1 Tax=Nocardia alni TaxID=2815723 RepID=UPI001C215A2E|nr:hypothetical protein [Nocardia alni]